jgi:hypothetical protein
MNKGEVSTINYYKYKRNGEENKNWDKINGKYGLVLIGDCALNNEFIKAIGRNLVRTTRSFLNNDVLMQ